MTISGPLPWAGIPDAAGVMVGAGIGVAACVGGAAGCVGIGVTVWEGTEVHAVRMITVATNAIAETLGIDSLPEIVLILINYTLSIWDTRPTATYILVKQSARPLNEAGFAFTGNGLEAYVTELRQDIFARAGATPIHELPRLKHRQRGKISGLIVARQYPPNDRTARLSTKGIIQAQKQSFCV